MKKIFLFLAVAATIVSCHKPMPIAYSTDGTKGTVTDHEGNVYETVMIGTQEWMAENMRCTTTTDGTEMLQEASMQGMSLTTPIAYEYKNNPENVENSYGYLYNWPAANAICPDGWHLPTSADFDTLETYLGGLNVYTVADNPYYIAKALADSIGWAYSKKTNAPGNDPQTNNAAGFNARPAGYYDGIFEGRDYETTFWSSSNMPTSEDYAYSRTVSFLKPTLTYSRGHKNNGLSVRCVKDDK